MTHARKRLRGKALERDRTEGEGGHKRPCMTSYLNDPNGDMTRTSVFCLFVLSSSDVLFVLFSFFLSCASINSQSWNGCGLSRRSRTSP